MIPDPSNLTVLLWNANGLTQHRNELDIYLHTQRIDIALITETHFTSHSHIHIADYTTYRTDHPDDRAQGGTAIFIRKSTTHHPLPSTSSESLMSTAIQISSSLFDFAVAAVYCPPNKQISQTQFISFFKSLGPKFLCGGDYNAKHQSFGCRAGNPRGTVLLNSLTTLRHQIITPRHPTYWPTSPRKRPDILDFFITSNLNPLNGLPSVVHDLSSDHSPVFLLLDVKPIPVPRRPSLIEGKMDWVGFQTGLETKINLKTPLKTHPEIESAVHYFTQAIQEAVCENCHKRPISERHNRLYLPLYIRKLLQEKRRARRLWQSTRYPSDRRIFDRLSNKLKNTLFQYKSELFKHHTETLTADDNSLWRSTKRLLSFKSYSTTLLQSNNTWTKSDEETANCFGQHLHSVFTPHQDHNDPFHFSIINDLNVPLPNPTLLKPFTPSEIESIIRNLPSKKAPGYDLITAHILKSLPEKAIRFLTYIYNSVLRTAHFPTLWKFSIIKMIPKPSKPTQSPSSYRPISLLPILGKILEKLLLLRLCPIVHSSNYIPDHQFGFRAQHSTIQQCHRVVDIIASTLERKQYCSAAFLDEAQAFDRVWHAGLLWKLKRILPSSYYLILESYLSDRFFRVSQGQALSNFFPVRAGVPQGSILSPILYMIYTADLPQHPSTVLASFADDKAILSTNEDPVTASLHLQEHLDSLQTWFRKWKIKVNPQKSVHITFTLRKNSSPPVFLNNVPLPVADTVKYLGLYIDRRLTWNPHTRLKRQEVNRRYGLLLRLLDNRSRLTLDNKLLIYKTVLKPMWTYGLELWGSAKPTNIQRIQVLQSRILRKITNAPFYVSNHTLHQDLNIPFVHNLAVETYNKFHSRLHPHPNPLVQNLSVPHLPDKPNRRLKRLWPRDLLQ